MPDVKPGQFYQWTTADIQLMIDDSIKKIPQPTGYASYSVKDWAALIAAVGSFVGVLGFGTVGHLNQSAIKSTVDTVQQVQVVQEKKSDDVANNEQKKNFNAAADSIGDNLKLWVDRTEANFKESGDAEDKRIAEDAKKAYQSHLDRQKNK